MLSRPVIIIKQANRECLLPDISRAIGQYLVTGTQMPCVFSDNLLIHSGHRHIYDLSFILLENCECYTDWLLSLKQFFINVSYHILVASLTLMALF